MGWGPYGTPSLRDLLTGREVPLLARRRIWPHAFFYMGGRPGGCLVSVYPRAISPDGKLLAVEGDDHTLRIWELASGREIRQFPHYRRPPGLIDETWEGQVVFSPDSKLLAAGDTPGSLCLWSLATGQAFRRFPHVEEGHGIAFTPDGKRLISGGNYFRYWDIARGRQIRRFPQPGGVEGVAFGPTSQLVATADGQVVRLWEASTGREIRQFRGHQATIGAIAIAPDGKTIASVDGYTANFPPSGRSAIASDGALILRDLSTGQELRRVEGLARPAKEGELVVWEPSVAFSPDGKMLVAADDSGARIWNTATGREIRRIRTGREVVRSLCFAPDGRSLAGTGFQSVIVWDVATWRRRKTWDAPHSVCVAFEPGGHALAAGDIDGVVKLRDVATGQTIREFRDDRYPADDPPVIRSLAFTPNGMTIAAGSDDSVVRLWDRATGRLRRRLKGHIHGVEAIAVAPDGKTLASASDDGTALIWDLTALGKD